MPEENSKPSRRQQILETLAQQLEAKPGQKITTASLAKAVGVSEAALYRHFPSKARMYEGLIEFIEDSIFGIIARIIEDDATSSGRCKKITALILTFSERNPGISRILVGDALMGEHERLHARIVQLFDRIESQYKQIMREGNLANELQREVHIAASANLFLSFAEGRMNQYVRSHFKRSPTAEWELQWQVVSGAIFA
ncbi:MAG: nucleoid occlusion factor SlmA [Chromatiales bacterium]|nr:nucleoid occlusion factor SlmA [Chromatiales bacterium]